MSCPTCDHRMQSVTKGTFWCPRCGTLRHGVDYKKPEFVEKVLIAGRVLHALLECVALPAERKWK